MRVLFIAAEVAPFSKVGGLADVAGALPAHLEAFGQEVMVVTPYHRAVPAAGHLVEPVWEEHPLDLGPHAFSYRTLLGEDGRTWFVDCPALYDRESVYTTDPDEHLRFLLLTRAALDLAHRRQWAPDIVHANDWQTAFGPLYLRSLYGLDPVFAEARSVLTIHNLGYQGVFPAELAPDIGLGGQSYLLHQGQLRAGRINFLLHGIMYADIITTVSPTYALEIQTPEVGVGLDPYLRRRGVTGILNGIDVAVWNPRTDPHLPWRFSEKSLWRKERDKEELLTRVGLAYEKGVPVAGIVSRLTGQKGIELIPGPVAHHVEAAGLRFVALGSGEAGFEHAFRLLAAAYPERVAFRTGYDEPLAHLIEAGSDLFLMPSLYEPCGLNQMYSLAYGTAPVVRRTGGLADTVADYDVETGEGTGFLFDHYTEQGLALALGRALAVHSHHPSFARLQRNAMAEDNSWERRTEDYLSLYSRLLGEGDRG